MLMCSFPNWFAITQNAQNNIANVEHVQQEAIL